MDRVATIADGVVYGDATETLSDGWRRQDGVLGAFWLISPSGRRWQVKTRFISTNVLELINVEEEEKYLIFHEGRGIRTVFDAGRPGYELARVLWEGSSGGSTFGVYAADADFGDGTSDWLIAAALAVAAVDGRRSIRG